jgi:glutathione synthase/RimK-type ligase-like ATP-grasp enzyme
MILIISAPEDVHAQAVLRALTQQGQDARLLNLSDFPMRMTVHMRLNDAASAFALRFPDDTVVRMDAVTAVWWRRPQPFGVPPQVTDPAHRQFAMSEAATAFQGMWQAHDALWVNNILRDAAAAHKPWQLDMARAVGLSIPETLITNSPDDARQFWQRHPGKVVYKAFSASYYAWRETRILRPEEEQLAGLVQLAPVIFQEYVPARVDLRITAIGERLFAAEAHSQDGEYAIDVRFNGDITYQPHALPDAVERDLLALMRRLGLEYGAIDMRLTPDGEYVFLEVNPAGQFLYVEQATGLPIAEALAEHLARGVPASPVPTPAERAEA